MPRTQKCDQYTIVFTFRNEKLKIFENELKNCFI